MAITIYNNGGSPENDFHEYSSLKISQSIHGHHSFDVLLPPSTSYDSLQEVAHLIGNKIKFDIKDGKQLIGVITTVNFKNNSDGQNFLHLIGYGAAILLENGLICQSFSEKSLNDIVEHIKNNNGAQLMKHLKSSGHFVIEGGKYEPQELLYSVQYKETPFDYISRLADTYGVWFYFNGEKLFFTTQPQESFPVELKLGENLSSIDVQFRLSTPQLNYISHNYEEDEVYEETASIDHLQSKDDLTKRALDESNSRFKIKGAIPAEMSFKNKEDLAAWTKRKFKSHTSSIVKFVGTSSEPLLKIGSLIKIVSEKNDIESVISTKHGVYRIVKLVHYSASEGVYSNSFEAIPKEMEIPPRNPYVVLPNCEPQSAIVIDNKDDEGFGRVKVRFRWQKEPESSPWIRVSSRYTNQGDGVYFTPEEQEEVLINFEYNNPELPYVEGSLFNGGNDGKNKPKYFDKENNYKVISTKKGNEIFINDKDGEETISIRNRDQSCFFMLNMKEKKITIKGDEIEMKSEGKITIEAKGDIAIKAKGGNLIEGNPIDLNP